MTRVYDFHRRRLYLPSSPERRRNIARFLGLILQVNSFRGYFFIGTFLNLMTWYHFLSTHCTFPFPAFLHFLLLSENHYRFLCLILHHSNLLICLAIFLHLSAQTVFSLAHLSVTYKYMRRVIEATAPPREKILNSKCKTLLSKLSIIYEH